MYIHTKNTNDLGGASTVIGNGKNMSNARGEVFKILNDAVEGGSAGEDEQSRLWLRKVRVGVGVGVRVRETATVIAIGRRWN